MTICIGAYPWLVRGLCDLCFDIRYTSFGHTGIVVALDEYSYVMHI